MQSTPMLEQYFAIKKKYENAILFFRLGDFYEMFGSDALIASKLLGITLTSRGKGTPHEIPMCGVPYHAKDTYIVKLTRAGKNVAICEQITPPGKGIVDRKVTHIITPGTTLQESVLDHKTNNFIAAIVKNNGMYGFAIGDISTGELSTHETANEETLRSILFRLSPQEIVTASGSESPSAQLVANLTETVVNEHTLPLGFNAREFLQTHFRVHSLDSFGIKSFPHAIEASGLLLHYVRETQKTALAHILTIRQYRYDTIMTLDETTIRNLELMQTLHDRGKDGTLLNVLDTTSTAMGGRRLKSWLLHPLQSQKKIEERLEAVACIKKTLDTQALQKLLGAIADIERIVGKIGLERVNARDLIYLKKSLIASCAVKQLLPQKNNTALLTYIQTEISDHKQLIELLERTLVDEPPIEITEAGMIQEGCNVELDDLKAISANGKQWLHELAAREKKRTGIASLKIKFNSVFGYYIEVSKANLANVPSDYIRKQTLVNAERFITPELKEFEDKILTAEETMKSLEYTLFIQLRETVKTHIPEIKKTASALGTLDVLTSFAHTAISHHYVKPSINESGVLSLRGGRHPVIEAQLKDDPYIPNDTHLSSENTIMLLTGPNMSGKSSYLRQTALIVLLAHIGSFVPADAADIPIIDQIFTRVGAGDNLTRGQSTFMVEMQETANILHNATEKSLIILDELGRGTSTYDGLSIAWAVLEYIHDTIGAKTLFATHYHELIDVAEKLPSAKNYSVAVTEHEGQIIFLHEVKEGGTPDSYGIEVAKLAGIPAPVISRSKEVLDELERNDTGRPAHKSNNL